MINKQTIFSTLMIMFIEISSILMGLIRNKEYHSSSRLYKSHIFLMNFRYSMPIFRNMVSIMSLNYVIILTIVSFVFFLLNENT